MRPLLLRGSVLVLMAGCESEQKAASMPVLTPQTSTGVVIIPPDSPKLAQIRVEPLRLANLSAGEVTAPGKTLIELPSLYYLMNRRREEPHDESRVPIPDELPADDVDLTEKNAEEVLVD
jgi:hypothetical protein